MSNEDLLDSLLSIASEELEKLDNRPSSNTHKNNSLVDVDIFSDEGSLLKVPNSEISRKLTNTNAVHTGDTDSSDDEDNRCYEERRYSNCGKEIKELLEVRNSDISSFIGQPKKRISSYVKNDFVVSSPVNVNVVPIINLPLKDAKRNSFVGTLKEPKEKFSDVFVDPVFGMRISNPLISSQLLKEKMIGREAVPFSKISGHINSLCKDKDWVICGVIVNKSPVKISQKGTQFSIWTLTDLKDDIKTVSLFLFSSSHKEFWKTSVGTVIGVLNPNVLNLKEGSKDAACLSVDNSQKVMVFGQSKDFGTCKSVKKNGEQCTSIVNLNRCEFCVYHIKQEYQKCSKRSELQANFAGKGLTALRNKVLGKNEVFYAGKSYMAIPAKKSKKLEQKEQNIINRLNGQSSSTTKNTPKKRQAARQLETSHAQRKRDLDLLKKLGGSDLDTQLSFSNVHSSDVTLEESKSNALSIISKLKSKQQEEPVLKSSENFNLKGDLLVNVDRKNSFTGKFSESPSLRDSKCAALNVIATLKAKQAECTDKADNHAINMPNTKLLSPNTKVFQTSSNTSSVESKKEPSSNFGFNKNIAFGTPMLSGFASKMIDLNKPVTKHHIDRAKINAIQLIQKNGPIKKVDPNSTRGIGMKRALEEPGSDGIFKKSKLEESGVISDRFKKMMAATSKHTDLIEAHDDEEKQKYFNKLEVKERMEEKMTTTYKIPCKAVKCLKCKYTSFSASEHCKLEKHPLKVFDALKRFFKCGNCQNRTASLELIPTRPCNNCGSGKWERTGMAKEKIATLTSTLSIRGGEQKFINSVASDANLDLLVPEGGA